MTSNSAADGEKAQWASFWSWAPVAIVLAGAVLARGIAFLKDPNLWIDEAMLYGAIDSASSIMPWTSLPLFSQAAPFAPLLLYKALIETVGTNEFILRLPSLLMSITALLVITLLLRRVLSPVGAAAGLILAGLSTEAIIQATEFKQYSFEFFASAMILLVALRLYGNTQSRSRVWLFAAISIGALPFSFTAPIVTAACGLAIVATEVAENGWRGIARLRTFLAAGVLWLAVAAVWQFVAVEGAVGVQFEGGASRYALGILSFSRPETFITAAKVLVSTSTIWMEPTILRRLLTVGILLLWAVGILIDGRRHFRLHAPLIALLLILVVLSLSGKLPILRERQFIFALPIFGLSFGASVQSIVQAMLRFRLADRWRTLATVGATVSALVLVLALFAVERSVTHSRGEQVGTLLSRIQPGVCPTVWAYYAAWPAVRIYGSRLRNAQYIGQVSFATMVPYWQIVVRDRFPEYRKEIQAQIAPYDRICLLFSHYIGNQDGDGFVRSILADTRTSHSCTLLQAMPGTHLYSCQHV